MNYLRGRLRSFGSGLEPQLMHHGDDGAGDRRVIRITGNIAYGRLVDFQRVDRKPM